MEKKENDNLENLTSELLYGKLYYKTMTLEGDLKEVINYLDEDNINAVFGEAYKQIEEILHEEHGYSEREIENKLDDIFNDSKKYIRELIKKSRSSEIVEKIDNVHWETESKTDKASDYASHGVEDTNKLKNEILNSTSQVLNQESSNKADTVSLIEDGIDEMKKQIERKLYMFDDPRAEEAFEEVSGYIDSKLLSNMEDVYLMSTDSLNKSFEELYSEVLNEIFAEYDKEKQSIDEKNKTKLGEIGNNGESPKEEGISKKLGLSDLVVAPEDAHKNTQEREQNKPKDKTRLEDLFK